MKRLFDILLSLTALVILSPLLVPVVIILLATGEHHVFYRQKRIGKGGESFDILKFATMLKDSPNMSGGDITGFRDPRILPFGYVLRKSKINELPQLLNILLGDMSIIGPRPLTPRVFAPFPDEYKEAVAKVRPGLSGVGSIVFRDEELLLRNAEDREAFYNEVIRPYKASLEVWYVAHQGLLLDVKLIALTIGAVIYPGLKIENHLSALPPRPENLSRHMSGASGPEGVD